MTVIKYVWSLRGKAPNDMLRDDVRFLAALQLWALKLKLL